MANKQQVEERGGQRVGGQQRGGDMVEREGDMAGEGDLAGEGVGEDLTIQGVKGRAAAGTVSSLKGA